MASSVNSVVFVVFLMILLISTGKQSFQIGLKKKQSFQISKIMVSPLDYFICTCLYNIFKIVASKVKMAY